ncbi:NTP transferase domain-containing protein [Candidatus Woesebacteria bacterium]|nr:NTP transferase domain-containing protein [Candidatus Woesebacteria bacterium]
MNILILAAGYGTRLEQFGINLPKGLIEVNGKTILSRMLNDISTLQYNHLLLITNNRFFDLYKEYCADNSCERLEVMSDNTTDPELRLGGVGDILFALDQKNWWNEDLLVCPTDTPTHLSLKDFIQFCDATAKGHSATIFKQMPIDQIAGRLGCATLNKEHLLTGFFEKPNTPPSNLAAIPFYYYSKEALTYIRGHKESLKDKTGKTLDAPGNLIRWLVQAQQDVYGYGMKEEAIDIGTMEDVQKANGMEV